MIPHSRPELSLPEIEAVVADTQQAMAEASRLVLDGFELRTEAKIVRWPDRYMDERGTEMWRTIMEILADLGQEVIPAELLIGEV